MRDCDCQSVYCLWTSMRKRHRGLIVEEAESCNFATERWKFPKQDMSTTALRCVALLRARCCALLRVVRCAARCRDSKNKNFWFIQREAFPLQLRVALRCVEFKIETPIVFLFFVYYPSDSNCVDQWERSTSSSRSSNCSTDSWKYRWNRAGSERSYCIRCWYLPWSSRSAMTRWIQNLGLRFLFCATYVQQAAAPNGNKFSYLSAILTLQHFFTKMFPPGFNALQQALLRVASRCGVFKRVQTQRNA